MERIDVDQVTKCSGITQLLMQDSIPWYKKRNLRSLYLNLIPAALGAEICSGYDQSVMNGLQAVSSWKDYFNHPDGALLGLLTASISIGAVLVLPAVPWVHNRLGCKASILFGTVILVVGAVLQTASVNTTMFMISRIIIGTGISFTVTNAGQLIAELSYPRERSIITGLFNEFWYIGSIMAAGITLGSYSISSTWAWRLPLLLQILPSLLQISFIWRVPESPRWLISKGRTEEAFDILATFHAEGNREDPFVLAEFRQIFETLNLETEQSQNRTWAKLFKGRPNFHRIVLASCVGLFSQWAGNGLVSYYLSKVLTSVGISASRTQNQINLGLQCWNLATGVSSCFITKILRRRRQYLISFTGMTIVFACWTGASAIFEQTANNQAATAVVCLIFVYYGFYNLMMPLTYVYITEVFPFISRSKGLTITQFFSRGGSGFNQAVNPIGLQYLGWKFYFFYVAMLAVETTTIFFLYPETKGAMLEEVAIVLEGSSANVATLNRSQRDDSTASQTDYSEKGGEKAKNVGGCLTVGICD